MLGSDAWYGGFWNRSGGHVNPLALARGLARAAVDAGARIHGQTPALYFAHRDGRWVVDTPSGTVSARALVLATNAYTGEFSSTLHRRIAHELVPVLSWQMATQPLPDEEVAATLPVVQHVMQDAPFPAVLLSVPLHVDARAADNWDEAH